MDDKINAYAIHELGKRSNQEDSLYPPASEKAFHGRLFILCDGMGGHAAGEVASQAVCDAMSRYVETHPREDGLFEERDFRAALDAAYDALLYDSVTATVDNKKPYEKEHVFYPYPNPTDKDTYDATWQPRHSILVVEVTFQGKKGYYPIVLPVLERNKTYVIDELVIRHRPGDVPYKPLETGDATVQITVNEWELGLNMGKVTL